MALRTHRGLSCMVLTTVLALPVGAHAGDTWTTPHPGVRHLYRTTSTPWRIHALVINLCARGVSLRATDAGEKWRTASSFGNLVGAEAAINGDFFSYDTHLPTGMAMGAGHQWKADTSSSITLGFGGDTVSYLTGLLAAPPVWMRNAIGGRPLLVSDGEALTSFNRSDCSVRHPRTASGLSQDKQTLYLAVVDGRSSVSAGMTCRELAVLMQGLGAHTAINHDGGGSTTMWIRGTGVVNSPSDGSQRVVSNHLAIHATGAGAPASCDWSVDEPILQASVLDDGGSTDVDGDGLADLCARASAGYRCYPSTGDGFAARWTIPQLASASGWDDETNYATIRTGDINGDGLADVCARGDRGVLCYPSTGSGFGDELEGPELADSVGWANPKYFATLRLADVNGDGMDDVCARAAAGFRCYLSTGTGFSGVVPGPELSDASGWGGIDHWGTIRMGDVDGDGMDDVCARARAGMRCWRSDGAGFPTRISGPAWSDAAGWDALPYWSTIRLVDLDGDGRADLCGRSPEGVRCALSTGDGFGPELEGPALRDASGWRDHANYSTIRMADVDGDGDVDLCARANARVYCWLFDGAGFPERIQGPELSDAAGWGDHRYYSSLRLGDLDGDGKADLCARGVHGVFCWRSDGAGFPDEIDGPPFTDEVGWANLKFYSTLRFAGPRCRSERCDGRDNDCDGEIDEGCGEADPETDAISPDAQDDDDAGAATPDHAGGEDAGEAYAGEEDAATWVLEDEDPERPRTGFDCRGYGGGSASGALLLLGALYFERRRRTR